MTSMTKLLAVIIATLFATSAAAQTSCYWYQGKQVCCTKIGYQTFCN